MGKHTDRYFKVHPWNVIEDGFDPEHALVAESIFSLGNEYMGLRGYFDEGYSGPRLLGSYVNGIYERRAVPKSAYRGMIDSAEFMVNTVDWLHTRIACNGEKLDLATCVFTGFTRTLDLKTAVLRRRFVWNVDPATSVAVAFERFLSMEHPRVGGQRILCEVLTGRAKIEIRAGLDFSPRHESMQKNFWECFALESGNDFCALGAKTESTGRHLYAVCVFTGMEASPGEGGADAAEKLSVLVFRKTLAHGEKCALERLACITAPCSAAEANNFRSGEAADFLRAQEYEALKADAAAWWEKRWKDTDIVIAGDEASQQGIRYCIFQMHQTLHASEHSALIGAKGMTGEVYNGNTFWDTEVYCLPFFLFNNPAAARSILRFRYDTLEEAKKRARALDCAGAFYPVATISGNECCDLWQHASLQLQVSTAVMYGIFNYVRITGDEEFLHDQGAEMLVEICRMLATRGDWDPVTGEYGFYGVMGPDEFQMMVHNNCYTNFMARKTFEYTLRALEDMKKKAAGKYERLAEKTGLCDVELADWQRKGERMRIPCDPETLVFEQHDGFFRLPHVDVRAIPPEEFPLYGSWSYDRIYRNDMLKQPDVLMFLLLYNGDFTIDQIEANFDYYEPRCIHESSLSPSVHSILASQIGRPEPAYRFFEFAARIDLDNYNRNTHEGLHITSIAGSWMCIVYGFGGVRSDGEVLKLNPVLPDAWEAYSFSLRLKDSLLRVSVGRKNVVLQTENGAVEVSVYGRRMMITARPVEIGLNG